MGNQLSSTDASNYEVSQVFLSPGVSLDFPGGEMLLEIFSKECGKGLYCINSPPIFDSCGTWLGQTDTCCWAEVFDTTTGDKTTQPCFHIPQLQAGPINDIGIAASECDDESDTKFLSPNGAGELAQPCCPVGMTTHLQFNHPDKNLLSMKESAPAEYRCANFSITEIVPPSLEFLGRIASLMTESATGAFPSTWPLPSMSIFHTAVISKASMSYTTTSAQSSPSTIVVISTRSASVEVVSSTKVDPSSRTSTQTSVQEETSASVPNSATKLEKWPRTSFVLVGCTLLAMYVGAQM